MNIYKVTQEEKEDYDTYDSFVIACEDEETARRTHPSSNVTHHKDGKWYGTYSGGPNSGKEYEVEIDDGSWVEGHQLDKVVVEFIGTAKEGIIGIICTSFNAG